jgi:hypothetical protein
VVAALALGFALLAAPASAKSCGHAQANGKIAYRINAHNIGCIKTRQHLRHWMRTRFPHHQVGWYCDTSGRRKLCSAGNGAAPPYFTFYLRRR